MTAQCWTLLGLVFSLLGIILLFIFGMPFRVKTAGATFLISEETNESEKRIDFYFGILGWLGFAFVVGGTIFQIIGTLKG